jgi:hypothetical protein
MTIAQLTDHTLLKFYDDIREQVAADNRSGGPYRLLGDVAKRRAEDLRAELSRRGLLFEPIDWP